MCIRDRDSCETALNSSSDVLFTAAAEYRQRRLEGRRDVYKRQGTYITSMDIYGIGRA